MSFTALTRLSLSIGALAIALASPSTARAQACQDTTQCPQGFVCEISAVPVPPVADPGPCPSNAPDCVKANTSSGATVPADFAPTTRGSCQPAPCTKDSECGAGMLCHSETRKECSGGTAPAIACAPNSDCGKGGGVPVPETCTETKVSLCVYKWQLPCNTDVDCGAGFNCTPTQSGSCSGGGGTGTPGAGATVPSDVARNIGAPAPIPSDSTCTTTTSFPGYCQPKATTCAADTDCPTAWTCSAANTSTPVTDGPTSGGGTIGADGGASLAAPPATDLPAPKPPEETTKVCQAPYGYGRDDGTIGKGDPTANPENPKPATTDQPGGSKPPAEAADTSPKAGCAVGGDLNGASFALVAFGLVGIAFARRRRQ